LRGIEPWSSLPSSAPITTEPTNDWYIVLVLIIHKNATPTTLS
jgi:hypothetical protein